ncbi:MAG: T9SS type A sorting domain-containing protein, partial [Bacteroidia bacterium]
VTTWAGPSSYTATGSAITVASPSVATTYTCTINMVGTCGCANVTQTITIQPPPTCTGTQPTYTPTTSSFTSNPGYFASNMYINNGVNYTISSADVRFAAGVSINVAFGGTLTIAGSWLHACNPCNSSAMWQGIIVSPGGTVIMQTGGTLFSLKYNIIEDAIEAVHTSSTGTTTATVWDIESTIFNNNGKGIYIGAHPGNLSSNVVGNCVFTCRNLGSHSLSSSNFSAIRTDILASTPTITSTANPTDVTIAGQRSTHGIQLNSVSNYTAPITVGGSSYSSNIFDNMDYGIYAYQSSLTAQNNVFQNLTGNSYTTTPTGVGIYCDAYLTSTTGVNASLTIGNTGTTTVSGETNTFANCLDGVYTRNMRNLYINNNTFNNETTATTFTTNGSLVIGQYGIYNAGYAASAVTTTENMILSNNTIQNYATGVYLDFQKLYHRSTASSYIYNNIINGAGTSAQYCTVGLQMQQSNSFGATGGFPRDGLMVSTNSVTNTNRNAIYASSITSDSLITVKTNTLSIKYTTAGTSTLTPPYAAAYISGCNYFKFWNNTIYCEGLTGSYPTSYAQYLAGVYVDGSTKSRITCNAVSFLGEDFVWKGNSAGSWWYENTMSSSRYGLVLRSSGILGDQGHTDHAIYDVWGNSDITSFQTLCDNSDPSSGTTSKLNCVITSTVCTAPTTQKPCTNTVTGTGAAYSASNTLINVTGSFTLGLCVGETPGTGRMANNNNVQDINSDSVLSSLLNFTDSLPVYTSQTYWGTQYYVSSVNSNLAAVQGFENAKNFAMIDAAIAADSVNDFSAAQTSLNAVNPKNTIESNWKTVDNIIIKMHSDSLGQNDISSLKNVAVQCPQSGGNIVWKARAILNNYYGFTADYSGDCPEITGNPLAKTAKVSSINNTEKVQSVNLYPNPNNGNMTLDYTIKEDSRLEITDISGNLVSIYNLPVTGTSLQIKNEGLQNGIYLYRVIGADGIIKTGKIVLMK